MKTWIRKTGAAIKSDPINHQAWRETVDDFDVVLQTAFDQDTEEAAVETWLEYPETFVGQNASGSDKIASPMLRRVPIGGNGIQRASDPRLKTAAVSNWDEEFAAAKTHVASVLKHFGGN